MGRVYVLLMMNEQKNTIRALFDGAQAVIFDIDDTLLSYQMGERGVFERIFAENGIECSEEAVAWVWKISWEEWDRLNLSETDRPEVAERFHDLYRHYLAVFFDVLSERFAFCDSNEVLCRKFIEYLSLQNDYCIGAERLLRALDGRYILAVATSGLSDIQNRRIDRLPAKIDYRFISEEIGFVKPSPKFFAHMCRQMDIAPQKCLMIGDSLRSDIGGALASGMKAIWVHKGGSQADCPSVETLEEIVEVLSADEND